MKAVIAGKDFKQLIGNVTNFPGISGYAGSGLVNLKVKDGKATAISSGLVTSKSWTEGTGELPYIAVDDRIIEPFSVACPAERKVFLETTDVLRMKCSGEETLPITKGVHYDLVKISSLIAAQKYVITKELAGNIKYLASVAYADSSRPELNCVMLDGNGSAMAASQKLIADLQLKEKHTDRLAVSVPFARLIEEGDELFVGYSELKEVTTGKMRKEYVSILKRPGVMYQMPSPVRAQEEFPVDAIRSYQKAKKKEVAILDGPTFVASLQEANTCLAQLSKLDLRLRLMSVKETVVLVGEKGTVVFKKKLIGTAKETFDISVPMDELLQIMPFLGKEPQVTISTGVEHNETFFTFSAGWVMMPALSKK